MVPLTAYSPRGRDCTAIPGVADVSCEAGECVVRRCSHGLVPGPDGGSCVPKTSHHHQHHHHPTDADADAEDNAEFAPAGPYGFEHVPLE